MKCVMGTSTYPPPPVPRSLPGLALEDRMGTGFRILLEKCLFKEYEKARACLRGRTGELSQAGPGAQGAGAGGRGGAEVPEHRPQQLARYIPAGREQGLAWASPAPAPREPSPGPAATCGESPLDQGHAVAAAQQLQVQAGQRGALAGELRGHGAGGAGPRLRLPAGGQASRACGAGGQGSAPAAGPLHRPGPWEPRSGVLQVPRAAVPPVLTSADHPRLFPRSSPPSQS